MPYLINWRNVPIFKNLIIPRILFAICLLPAILTMDPGKIFILRIKHWLERVRFYLLLYIWPFLNALKNRCPLP